MEDSLGWNVFHSLSREEQEANEQLLNESWRWCSSLSQESFVTTWLFLLKRVTDDTIISVIFIIITVFPVVNLPLTSESLWSKQQDVNQRQLKHPFEGKQSVGNTDNFMVSMLQWKSRTPSKSVMKSNVFSCLFFSHWQLMTSKTRILCLSIERISMSSSSHVLFTFLMRWENKEL